MMMMMMMMLMVTHLHQFGVMHVEAERVRDNLTLLDAVSHNVSRRRHLARESNGKRLLFPAHCKTTAKQYASTGRNLQQQTTPPNGRPPK